MAKTMLIIDPAVILTAKDLRELSESYVVLRCAPSQVVVPILDADALTVSAGLQMLASDEAYVEPKAWRSWLAKKFVAAARERRGDA